MKWVLSFFLIIIAMKNIKDYALIALLIIFQSGNLFAQKKYTDYSAKDKQNIFIENFNNNFNKWTIDNNWISGKIENGHYLLNCKNYKNTTGLSYHSVDIDENKDFEIETKIKIINGNGALVFGMDDNFNHYRLEISDKNKFFILKNVVAKNTISKIYHTSILNIINQNNFNKITLRSINSVFYVFINEKFIKEFNKLPFFGDKIGFSVATNSKIEIEQIQISYIKKPENKLVAQSKPELKPQSQVKKHIFPFLSISDINFIDKNNNDCIDADENCSIFFIISNNGKGVATNVKANINTKFFITGLNFEKTILIGNIKPDSSVNVNIPVSGMQDLNSDTANFSINFDEQYGFPPDAFEIQIITKKYNSPLVRVVDYSFETDNGFIKLGVPVQLKALIQNVGFGKAENVSVDFEYPNQNVFPNNQSHYELHTLNPGDSKALVFEFLANKLYSETSIPINIRINEKYGKYSENKFAVVMVYNASNNQKVVISSNENERKREIKIASLSADIDKNIPVNQSINQHRYALIIGNEDYSTYQKGLSSEVNVDFAENDAKIFKEYVVNTMGVPEKQTKLLTNATSGQMSQGIAWLANLAKIENGNAEIIFYYSGHGLPDETTKEPYLIPVDVSGLSVAQGIKLNGLLKTLTKHPAKRITLFLDACFSGGARNKGLIAMKGVKIRPKNVALQGNLVLFSSSSGEQSSGVYREKKHGFFTYYLLKKIQETKGNITYKELANYVILNVSKETSLISKPQTPGLENSLQVKDEWANWKIY